MPEVGRVSHRTDADFDVAAWLARVSRRENHQSKGRRYLLEGRVCVRHVSREGIRAHVRGQGDRYRVEWTPAAGWSCTCPARSRCAHLVAVQLVTIIRSNA